MPTYIAAGAEVDIAVIHRSYVGQRFNQFMVPITVNESFTANNSEERCYYFVLFNTAEILNTL